MIYSDFDKLKIFLLELKRCKFRPELIRSRFAINGQLATIDKNECFNLLRGKIDGLKGKDDDYITKYLKDPKNLEKYILAGFTATERQDLEKSLTLVKEEGTEQQVVERTTEGTAAQQVTTGEPAAMAGGAMPQIPNFSSAPVIHNVPRVNRPERPPQVKTYPKPPIVETGLDYEGKPYEKEAAGAKTGGSRFEAKMPYQVTNAAKNFGSAAQRFIGTNLGRIGRGLGGIATGVGRGIAGPGLTGAYNLLGKAATGGLNAFGRLSSISGPKLGGIGFSKGFGTGKKAVLAFSLFGLFFAFSLFSAIAQPPSPAEAAPTYAPGAGKGIVSCPLNGTVSITNGSKAIGGHCSPDYEKAYGVCIKPANPGYTGKDTAIDVVSADKLVYLPNISGISGKVQWTVDEAGNIPISEGEGGGISVAAQITANNKTYRIRFVHIESTSLKFGDKVDPGTPVGQYYQNNPYGAHAHITIQEDTVFKPADLYFNLCR